MERKGRSWSREVKEKALSACGRFCCICRKRCGTNIELHHIEQAADGGKNTFENCIPLCFDCHADAGHYNVRHPKGTKFSATELRRHRDNWFRIFESKTEFETTSESAGERQFYHEGETCSLTGLMWREGPPGPESGMPPLIVGSRWWILNLPCPIKFRSLSFEGDATSVQEISRIQLLLTSELYDVNRHLLNSVVTVIGKLEQSHTAHHIGDALFDVALLRAKD